MNYEGTSHQRLQAQEQLKCYLPQAAFDELLKHHTRLDYPKDAPIFLQGAPADVTFYVLNGIVKMYCPKGDGDRVLLQLAGPGDVLGYIDSLGSEGRRSQVFEAQALTRCTLALVTREHLRKSAEMLERDSLVRGIELINTAWSAVARWYAVFLGLSLKERLEAVFRELATRFGVKEKRGVLLLPELSHMDFAEMIQSSRPMVSRLIGQMIDDGFLGRRGRQYIVTDRLLLGGEFRQGEAMSNGHAASRASEVMAPVLSMVGSRRSTMAPTIRASQSHSELDT